MRHLIFRGSFLKKVLTIVSALAFVCVQTPTARAQRGGGARSGGRVAGPPMSAPRAPAAPRPIMMPPPPRPVAPWRPAAISPPPGPVAPRSFPMPSAPRRFGQPPRAGFGAPGFHPQLIPPKRLPLPRRIIVRPVAPIFSYPVVFGAPFFFGLGSGFNALWWQGCGPFSLWYLGCNSAPFYGYGFGDYLSASSDFYEPPPLPAYQPLYLYSGQPRELAELYLKDGTVYDVTDYWLVNDELHFTATEDEKSVEHTIPFDDLDLQKTVDVNTQRGFHFVLRNEPIDQYLQDHAEIGSSTASPAAPAAPPQTQASPGTLQPESPASPHTAPGPPQTQSPDPANQAPQP